MAFELLSSRLNHAKQAFVRHQTVPIWHRQAIYAALGARYYGFERKPVATVNRSPGHIRRTKLMLLTLDYAIPYADVWSNAEYEREMQLFLLAIRRVVMGEQWETFSLPHSGIGHHDAYASGDLIYVATSYAWHSVSQDTEYTLDPLEPERDDKQLLALQFDTAGLVALALHKQYIGTYFDSDNRPISLPNINPSVYWEWWLDEAVLAAWNAFSL
jgi:hypothetical protein